MGWQSGYRIVTAAIASGACLVLGACETRISTSVTANAPIAYSHVYVTLAQVWVNASATAGPDDSAWIKATLDAPQTVDLVGLTSGTLKEFASQLPVPSGTYNQLRLVLSDTSASLTSSAQAAGAQFNNEVDYFDTAGTLQRARLDVPNAASGIAVPITLDVQTSQDAILAALASSSATSSLGSSSSSSSPLGSSGTGTQTSTSTTTTTTSTSTDTTGLGTVSASAAIVFDASRDIARYTYGNQTGFALNARLTGQDLATVGTIRSQLSLGSLTLDASTSRPSVQVTAETPSSDGSRNVPVLSAPLRSDGTFILYPFPMDDKAPTTYDLVIHGPGIQTLIIKSVPVQSGSPSSAATVNLNSIALLLAAATYPVNVSAANPAARGARIGLYQTVNASGELPYLIEERTVDPITGRFALDQTIPADNLAVGTYSSGTTLTLTTQTPLEGTGAYKLASSGALFGDGAFGDTLTAPATGTTTATTFNAPALAIPTGAVAGTITATVNVSTPNRYDKGALVITHDGAIVTSVLLDSLLVPAQASGVLTISAVPAGDGTTAFAEGTYYAEAWAWNSSDPSGSFVRQPAGTLIDLRATPNASVTLTLD